MPHLQPAAEGWITRRLHFSYSLRSKGASAADEIDALCEEGKRLLGSLDGVVLPELALTPQDYAAVRLRVLGKSLMLVSGIGQKGEEGRPSANYLSVDVPLSQHHAIQFRQDKHHRWRLDDRQIRMYRIGARLHTEKSYWEDIEITDRRLLFLVLRPWLVTSVLVCEDLARHDPVGELLRSVGPHLVIALLMDGPQLSNRWSSRYAAVLADDPGCSVLSVSSLGMISLSRSDTKTEPSRTVALWKDARGGIRELDLPVGASALALTISVEHGREVTADGRADSSAFPVLTGFHAVTLPESREKLTPQQASKPDFRMISKDAARRFLSPHEAAALARLVQQDIKKDPAPTVLRELTGEALGIAREIWRLRIEESLFKEGLAEPRRESDAFWGTPTSEQAKTAKEIFKWKNTNKNG